MYVCDMHAHQQKIINLSMSYTNLLVFILGVMFLITLSFADYSQHHIYKPPFENSQAKKITQSPLEPESLPPPTSLPPPMYMLPPGPGSLPPPMYMVPPGPAALPPPTSLPPPMYMVPPGPGALPSLTSLPQAMPFVIKHSQAKKVALFPILDSKKNIQDEMLSSSALPLPPPILS